MFEAYKVYGPYLRKDGRKHVVLVDLVSKKKTTVSYPKYLYQLHHNIELLKSDTIDHKDRDYTNDAIGNLILVRTQSEHSTIDAIYVKPIVLRCAWCDVEFERRANQQHRRSKSGKAGPFCGRSCAGKYGKSVQITGNLFPVADPVPVEMREYYQLMK